MNDRTIRQCNSVGICVNHIPATFFTVRRHMAIWYILKNSLMKIADVIVVRKKRQDGMDTPVYDISPMTG